MKFKILLATQILLCLMAVSSCVNNKGKECSGADNCSGNDDGGKGDIRAKVEFLESYFYDQKLLKWRKFTIDELTHGGVDGEIPIYSDFVNIDKNSALQKISLAKQQNDNPSYFRPSDFSTIPYIATKIDPTYNYIYKYTKIDMSGTEIGGKTGNLIIDGSTGYIPFINEMFGGVFFPEAISSNQSSYTHKISIVAQGQGARASPPATIIFKASLTIPNRDFSASYSSQIRNMTIENRWNYFYSASDGNPNRDLELGSLKEATNTAESIPLDVKVLFKTAPRIEIAYTIFRENPLVILNKNLDTKINVLRGHEFYERSYVLNSERDFGLVFKINDLARPLTNSNREAEYRNIPAGQVWKLTFGYDLSQKGTYPAGKQLLKPLRPICHALKAEPFQPIQEKRLQTIQSNLGGFHSVCHPDTYERVVMTPDDLVAPPKTLEDTWHWAFSYQRNYDKVNSRVAGHFFGVKAIEFRISGCLKVMTREASPAPVNPNIYETKNNDSPECSSGPGDTGWMKYELSRNVTIFDNTLPYSNTAGLRELVDLYRSAIPKSSPTFFFNNDTFIEHIY